MAEETKKAAAKKAAPKATTKKVAAKKETEGTAKAPKATKKAAAPKASKTSEKKVEKVEKVEKVTKAPVTEATCIARDIRVTPRKVRYVADYVRGMNVDEALALLKHLNKAAALPIYKAIKSAAANATNNFGMDADKLYISEIQASDGMKMKRFTPRAKGSASPITKRMSYLRVSVKQK